MNKDARFRWASVALYNRVRDTADKEDRSLSNMINRLLSEALDARESGAVGATVGPHSARAAAIKHEGTVR